MKTTKFLTIVVFAINIFTANNFVAQNEFNSSKTQLEKHIDSLLLIQDTIRIDLYVMSLCPYAIELEKELIPIIKKNQDRINFNLWFIVNKDKDGNYTSLHGKDELDENKKQILIQKYYPNKFLDYLHDLSYNINKEYTNLNFTGIDTIIKFNLFEYNFCTTMQKKIKQSPCIFINNEYINFKAVNPKALICCCISTVCTRVSAENCGYAEGTVTSCNNSCFPNPCIPTPIKIINFLAKLNQNNQHILIQWETASETNNDYFTIERSINAKNYIGLSSIKGAGNSNTIKSYSYVDNEIEKNTIYYYRLKQTDFDGKFKYYGPISVITGKEPFQIVSVYPNPCKNQFFIKTRGSLKEKYFTVKLYNYIGMKVYEKTITNINSKEIEIDINNKISEGLHLLQIHTKDIVFSEKIIIQ